MSSTIGCGARWNKCPSPSNQYANDVSSLNETPNRSPATSPGNKRKQPDATSPVNKRKQSDDANEKKEDSTTKTGKDNDSQKADAGEKENIVDESQPFDLKQMDSDNAEQQEKPSKPPRLTRSNAQKITKAKAEVSDGSSSSEGDSGDDDWEAKFLKRKNVVFERFLDQRRGHALTKWLKRKPSEDQSYDCYARSLGDDYVIKAKRSSFVNVGLFGYGQKCGDFMYDKPINVQGYGSKIVDGKLKVDNGQRYYGLRGDTTLSIYNDSEEDFTIANNTKIATINFNNVYLPPNIMIDAMHAHQCTRDKDEPRAQVWKV